MSVAPAIRQVAHLASRNEPLDGGVVPQIATTCESLQEVGLDYGAGFGRVVYRLERPALDVTPSA
jgi:hypothetical protein